MGGISTMDSKIKIGICGYGNLGRGVEETIAAHRDLELAAVFTRRTPEIKSNVPVVHVNNAAEWRDKIDVMILCGGSANDLQTQGPELAELFNTVDSFDTHAKIPEYFAKVDDAAKDGGNISIISIGWDPGLFSLMRLYMGAALPNGDTYTFWGQGVSQGHSQAIRKIDGVIDAVQYTIPSEEALERVKKGDRPTLTAGEKHRRLCYVATEPGVDPHFVEEKIKQMPQYFKGYETVVKFISLDNLRAHHSGIPHGGTVIRTGQTGADNEAHQQTLEFSLKLGSNPEFTSSVLLAFARAAYKLAKKGESGARTIFDIPPIMLATHDPMGLL
jgi:diaminopimelate dehydrogenase